MSMPMVMIATTNAGRPTIGRIAVLSITSAMRAVSRAAIPMDRKKEKVANSTTPMAGPT
jgi:hypothetical protein